MSMTVFIEVPAEREQFLRRFLALTEELDHLADTAPDGTVLDACEQAVVAKGREVQRALLQQAVQRRVEAAEKKGRRSAPASVAGARKTAGPKVVPC